MQTLTDTGVQSNQASWQWDGNAERPTFTPSLLRHGVPEIGRPTCHSNVTDRDYVLDNPNGKAHRFGA